MRVVRCWNCRAENGIRRGDRASEYTCWRCQVELRDRPRGEENMLAPSVVVGATIGGLIGGASGAAIGAVVGAALGARGNRR